MRWGFVLIALQVFLFVPAAAPESEMAARPRSSTAETAAQSSTHEKVIPTQAGHRLVFRAICGDVHIFADSADAVKYLVRGDGQISGVAAAVSVIVRKTPEAITMIAPNALARECATGLIYEIHTPQRYDLDISVRAGNLRIEDIDGSAAVSTGGGDIVVGNIAKPDAGVADIGSERFLATLQTAGGDICVGNVAGGLRSQTSGGEIRAGNVHGAAVLRTGGGDIHIGRVFGAAQFSTGGGDIVAQKIDGAVWADTAGGHVEIGEAGKLPLPRPQLSRQAFDAFANEVPHGRMPGEPDSFPNGFITANEFSRLFDAFVWGGIRVPPAEQQNRLLAFVAPEYPRVAQRAGIDGDVMLRILVGRDGTIRVITPLSGPGVLERAAMRAVEQWRYAPTLVEGHPVDVVSTVMLAFRLHP